MLRVIPPHDGPSGTREPALAVRLDQPQGAAFGPDGRLYLADVNHHRLRRLDPDGLVVTIAGTGIPGDGGDGGAAIDADLRRCSGLAFDGAGGLYVADSGNHRVRYIAPDGRIATVAGDGQPGYAGDDGPAQNARLNYPTGVALGPDGALYIADAINNRVRRVGPDGAIVTIAGIGQPRPRPTDAVDATRIGAAQAAATLDDDRGLAVEAHLIWPWDVAVGPDGAVYIADLFNHCIRRVDPSGEIVTVAGAVGLAGLAGDGERARQPALFCPRGLAISATGDLMVADSGNERVCRVDGNGIVTVVAGDGHTGFSGDGGPAILAQLAHPWGVALAPDGRLVIADRGNRRIRQVDGAGVITTIVGGGPTDKEADAAPPDGPVTE